MTFYIATTDNFKKELKQLSKKYKSLPQDLDWLVKLLKEEPKIGVYLGDGCYKIRLKISSKSSGKSGGARIIICIKFTPDEVYLLSIYDKSEKESISSSFLKSLVKNIK